MEDQQPSPNNQYYAPDSSTLYKFNVGCPNSENTNIDTNTPTYSLTNWPSLTT